MSERDIIVPAVPGWNITVSTGDSGHYADLKNALVYADRVYWIPFEAVYELWTDRFNAFMRIMDQVKVILGREKNLAEQMKRGETTVTDVVDRASREASALRGDTVSKASHYEEFNDSLDASGLRSIVTVAWDRDDISEWTDYFRKHIRDPQNEAWMRELCEERKQEPTVAYEYVTYEAVIVHLVRIMQESVANSRVVVYEKELKPPPWNAHSRAHALMEALSRLLLPDVSTLPLGAIAEMRDGLQDTLDPLRAEMLQLSEELRKLTAAATHDELLREAEELIATRVEPVVRMANARARDLAKSRWRKFFVGIAKSFGFAGAGFLSPAMLTKALEEVLATGASIAETKESEHPAKASATFVLKARRLIARHDYS